MSSQKEFIEKFRKDKYKIDSEQEDIELLKQDLQNSISQLADDLYSDGIHFVLELIQNADDNKYISGKKPLLKFVIDEEKILVQNNEEGFENDNVISLCSVGKSKKTKEQGYIGEKGIGFKSVFRISDEPHIFSNGFQFKFKRVDKEYGLGYIVPYWIEDVPSFINNELTNILLPLNSEAKELLYKFNEIEPELLIFLRQLTTVEIDNKIDNTFHKFIKTEENDIVKINGKEKEIYFKLVSQELKVPENIKEERRNLTKTTLILGFPLNEDGTAKTSSEQKVFAFLPTRSYGFKFMIQADFLVPASREAIHNDKKWNDWLRDNISTVFSESVETFKKDKSLSTSFYKYIPLESEITDDLFSKVVEEIKNNLLDLDCILTESEKWLKPSQVFRASEQIRSLIPNNHLIEFFGKEYISREVENSVNQDILNFLEIPEFATNDLFKLLKNTEWLEKQSDKWLVELYDYLKRHLDNSEIDVVKDFRIVRLENGMMVSSAQAKPFFPFEENQVYGFESQLPFVKQELLKSKEFLQGLGIFNPQPFEIIENYILEDFENIDENSNWRSKTEEVRIGYIKYIKANLASYRTAKGNIERLNNTIRVKLKDNKFWFPKKVYLPKEYGDRYDLEFLLSGIENIYFIHPQYLESDQKEIINTELDEAKRIEKLAKVKEGWKNFFISLGAETKPRIDGDQTNYYSSIINSIILESDIKKNSTLVKVLDNEWNFYKKYLNKAVVYRPYRSRSYSTRYESADWYNKIANSKWLPAKNGSFKEPSKLFLDKPKIRGVLGDSVFYLDAEIENEEFIRALNINSEVKVETVLETLKHLVISKGENKERFEKLYSFLNEHYQGKEFQINKYFQDENLIFIPGISNNYVSSTKVIWRDESEILGDYSSYLENLYPKLKDFFVRKIGVPEKPTAKNYADALIEISKKDSVEKADKERIFKIYRELNKTLKSESPKNQTITQLTWWKEFIAKNIFWTNKFDFRCNDNVFVNDDKELYELFKEKTEIAFLKIPQDQNPAFAPFISKTGLKYLSKEVKSEIVHSMDYVEVEKLTNQVNELSIYIVRYLYQEENEIYETAKQDGRLLQLINLTCYGVEDLNVKYTLNTESAYSDNVLFLDESSMYLKIDNFDRLDNLKDFDRISIELAKIFGYPKGLSDFIETLFSKSSNEKREKSLITKKIGNLPKDEFEWFTKNFTQIINGETVPVNSAEFKVFYKDLQDDNLFSRNDQSNKHFALELDDRNKHQNNAKDDTDQTETEPSTSTHQNGTPQITPFEGNKSLSSEVEDVAKNDWNPEVDPTDVEPCGTKDVIPEFKPSNLSANRNFQTNSKSPSSERESKESNRDSLSQEAKTKIGRWGEEFAVEKLREKFLGKYPNCKLQETEAGFDILVNKQIIVEVNWLNKFGECGIGRDIEYIENGVKHFIEVKATKTDAKEIFQISRSEWQLAKDKQENYSIFRIYNAGTSYARPEEIRNPYKEWLEGNLSFQSLTIRI